MIRWTAEEECAVAVGIRDAERLAREAVAGIPLAEDILRKRPSRAERTRAGSVERLEAAVALRLRADVPVASYLSGGLDSSVVAAMAHRLSGEKLCTYGLGFDREGFDEREWQALMVKHLGVDHLGDRKSVV